MAIRVRSDGTLVCAAMSAEEPGDTYIDDAVHEVLGACRPTSADLLVADEDHETNGLWHWRKGTA